MSIRIILRYTGKYSNIAWLSLINYLVLFLTQIYWLFMSASKCPFLQTIIVKTSQKFTKKCNLLNFLQGDSVTVTLFFWVFLKEY